MAKINSIKDLEALYSTASSGSLDKVQRRLTPLYQEWINQAKFLVLATIGPEFCDASPRGDVGPVVTILDENTLVLPDWMGNNRLDSLRNIIADPRVSLMFMIPGVLNVVRIRGQATLHNEPDLLQLFNRKGKQPTTVIKIKVGSVYFQCAKALMRAGLWHASENLPKVPTAGEFLNEAQEGFEAAPYDEGYAAYAKHRLW